MSGEVVLSGVETLAVSLCADDIDQARRRLGAWLLDSGAQLRDGPHAGGVAGWLDNAGCAAYVYPEITGYYLQWLAWRAQGPDKCPRLRLRAQAAQGWLRGWIRRPDRQRTRIYLQTAARDWRNDAVFFFDLAMVARGLASATRTGLIDPDPQLIEDLVMQLSSLVQSDGVFAACLPCGADAALPDRWSTRRGGFLAKAAAGVLSAAETLPAFARLHAAARQTFDASMAQAISRPHSDTHPALYAMEAVLCGADRRSVAGCVSHLAGQWTTLVAHARDHGELPESRDSAGHARVDIVAQALRVGALLGADVASADARTRAARAAMMLRLVRHTKASGAMAFVPGRLPVQWNTWCAMFSEQALSVASAHTPKRSLDALAVYLV